MVRWFLCEGVCRFSWVKIVLMMSHRQKYFVSHVKWHHIDANPWGVRWVTPYTTIILEGRFALWRRWPSYVGNIESLIPSTLRLRWINSLVTKRQHDHMDMMEEWPIEDHWLLGRSTIMWCGIRSWPNGSLGVSCGMLLPVPMSRFGEDRAARLGHRTWRSS